MANPLLGVVGTQQRDNRSIGEQFKEFKANFKGDPKAVIDDLLAKGKITQAQLNEATALANLIGGMAKR